MELLVFIFHDGNREHLTQIYSSLHKQPWIVISIVCCILLGPILNQGKQGRNQVDIKEMSGKVTSLI